MSRRELSITALALAGLSAVLYALHYAIFRDMHHITVDLLEAVAFLPLQVLFLTLIVDRLLSEREKGARRHHMNMVIGTFFSSAGRPLLKLMCRFVGNPEVYSALALRPNWSEADVRHAVTALDEVELTVSAAPEALEALREELLEQREFLLRLLENPTLLEHEAFTDLLWATFHVVEELAARASLTGLPQADVNHLCVDIERFYALLLGQWLSYMIHLRANYPYLFSFAARTNPLREDAKAEIA